VRQIFPWDGHATGALGVADAHGGADALGVAEPVGAADPVKPSAPGPANDLVAELARIYAYPPGRWVRANMIASVDGAVALDGRSGGLSGAADRLLFAVLRSLADVIVVGAGTVRAERYRQSQPHELWQQLRAGRPPAPPVAVITRRLDLDLGHRLFARSSGPTSAGLARTIVLTTERAPAHRIAAARQVADVIIAGAESVKASGALESLTSCGYRRILVEGGPMLLGEFVADGLLDELCLTISPVLEGGHATGRVTTSRGRTNLTGLRLATVLEDDGFLLTRYVRAG
jgi:riboflavin biosynthesis pyrimidine reductase